MNNILKYFVALFLFSSFHLYGQKLENLPDSAFDTKISNQKMFHLWEIRPSIQNEELYSIADSVFSTNKSADYRMLSNHTRYKEYCIKYGSKILSGPMLGNISKSGVNIWIRTSSPAEVEIRLKNTKHNKTSNKSKSTYESDLTTVCRLTGLQPNTVYQYDIYVNNVKFDTQEVFSFKTLNTDTSETRIVFGSCYHRIGLGNIKLHNTILKQNPHAMLLLGDVAVQDRLSDFGKHRADYLARDMYPGWQKLTATTPVYASWDDHDYFDNDLSGIPKGFKKEDRDTVRMIFKNSNNNPSYGFEDTNEGVFFRTRIQSCDVIMLDTRYFRNGNKGSFLGEKQMEWLEKQLLDCKGPFIIISSGTMWSDYVSAGKDSWGVWDTLGRERIFQLIEKNKIAGVVFISGDRHGARGFKIPRPSGYEFYEFEIAGLGARGGPPATHPEWKTQLFGISGKYVFGKFTVNATLKDPTLNFQLMGENENIIFNLTLKRSELTPK